MTDADPSSPPDVDGSRIDEELVRRLLGDQFSRWSHLPVRRVVPGGNDHRTFRLGEDLSVRLPSAPGYVPQVEKEQTWLPRLAPRLPLPVPEVVGAGRASPAFPAPWSVVRWLPGHGPTASQVRDDERFAADLAGLLVALRSVEAADGPPPGAHSAFRGGPVEHYGDEVRDLLPRLVGRDRDTAEGMWRDALASPYDAPPVWVHGDVALANLLVDDGGRLRAVLDFGCAAVGDPACDTVFRWTRLRGTARRAFVDTLAVDDATWARGRGWALWKGLIMLSNTVPGQAEFARHVLDELLHEG